MSDGERIKYWLEAYNRYQRLRDMNERALIVMIETNDTDQERREYYEDRITDYEKQMKSLRERIMLYGDY